MAKPKKKYRTKGVHDDHAQEAHRRMRGKKITEDDPRFDPRTMGNKKGRLNPKPKYREYRPVKKHRV